MLQEVNLDVEISNGCSRPVGKDVGSLVFLQSLHAGIDLLTEVRIFGQQTRVNKE